MCAQARRENCTVWCSGTVQIRGAEVIGIDSYRKLEAWQQAMLLAERCYTTSADFPANETFGLRAQLRRAAVSVVSNIAEGHSRTTRRAYLHHLSIASGSQAEVETQIELARRLGFLKSDEATELWELTRSVGRLIGGLIRSLETGR
jgi:four helix bundle protein